MDGTPRAKYITEHWAEIEAKIQEGVGVSGVALLHGMPSSSLMYQLGIRGTINPKTGRVFIPSALARLKKGRKDKKPRHVIDLIPETESMGDMVLDALLSRIAGLTADRNVLKRKVEQLESKLAEVQLTLERQERDDLQEKARRRQAALALSGG